MTKLDIAIDQIIKLEEKVTEQKAMIYAMKEIIGALIKKYGIREDMEFRKEEKR